MYRLYCQKFWGDRGLIIYPRGDVGIRVIEIPRNIYGIVPDFIIDKAGIPARIIKFRFNKKKH